MGLLVLAVAGCSGGAASEATSSDARLAPDFSLSDSSGNVVVLSELLETHDAVVVVFYRGFF
ncbi:MAG: hypothetical protein O2854_08625 [Chloroflexi bacterium]|nr:hypothetical protein [Chloroflexota bacterium]